MIKKKLDLKNLILIISLYLFFFIKIIIADDSNLLENLLSKNKSFYSSFIQYIILPNKNILQEGKGELWVKYPNLFNCHTIEPEESWLISDGKTLWFYNLSLKQVTAFWFKEIINNTPFAIISTNNIFNSHLYNVHRKGDNFIIKSKNNLDLRYFLVNINNDGIIKKFSFIENNGQNIKYKLINYSTIFISNDKFNFKIPENVILDDQR